MARIVILGAGLTGLSTALHLEKNNLFDFAIFEKNATAGGLVRSVHHEGFTFDYTGHLLHSNNAYFQKFLNKLLTNNYTHIQRNSSVYSHEISVNYPFQMNLHGLPDKVVLDCIKGFFARKKHIRKPQTFHEWVIKYFGPGLAKHFFIPYNTKQLAYDVKKIDPGWTGNFVPKTDVDAFLLGALKKREKKGIGYNSSFYYPKTGGIQFFTNQIISQLKAPIHTNYKAEEIDLSKKIVRFTNGHEESYEILVTTLPLNRLLTRIKEPSSSSLQKNAGKLLCNSVLNFNIGLNRPEISKKHWIYFPEKKYAFYRIGFWNNFSSHLAPEKCSSLYGEISYLPGKKTKKELAEITKQSLKDLKKILGFSHSDIITQKTLHLHHAYVIYDMWRKKNLPKLLLRLKKESIFSIGRFGAWKYSSMQDAILDGKMMAETCKTFMQKIIPARKDSLKNLVIREKKAEIRNKRKYEKEI